MAKYSIKNTVTGLVLCCAAMLSFSTNAAVAVVVNPGFADSLDQAKVAQIYLGKDKTLTPYMQSGGTADEFIDIPRPVARGTRELSERQVYSRVESRVLTVVYCDFD